MLGARKNVMIYGDDWQERLIPLCTSKGKRIARSSPVIVSSPGDAYPKGASFSREDLVITLGIPGGFPTGTVFCISGIHYIVKTIDKDGRIITSLFTDSGKEWPGRYSSAWHHKIKSAPVDDPYPSGLVPDVVID